MKALMMDTQLLTSAVVRHADQNHPNREIVSVTVDNPLHRYTYRDCFRRTRQLANALGRLGLEQGDRVATLAWNDYRHMEAYHAIGGAGYVCHTINPRLFPEQVAFIINHAEDRFVMVDVLVLPLLEKLKDHIKGVEGIIVMTSEAAMPETSLDNVMCYETLIASESDEYEWPELDENAPVAMCYTSGTTGDPKGVVYSHRSQVLHAYASITTDATGLSNRDTVLPVVPLFHVNAWGIPYSAPMVGAKLVFPGPKMGDGETLHKLMEAEKVTMALGVPTVWTALLQHLETTGGTLSTVQRTLIGGAAVPESMIREFRDKHDVEVCQGWGMTEMSPIGTVGTLKAGMEDALSAEEQVTVRAKAGRGIFGVEMRIVDDEGGALAWDGQKAGALQVRGPWVCSDYYRLEGSAGTHTADGWFETGDVAKIDAEGYLQITDRTKDVIKSGGEWVSSIDVENVAAGHPAIGHAAVIGVKHSKWSERPLLIVVPKDGEKPEPADILSWFDGKIASWWVPDDVVFIDEMPLTATGKIKKIDLRERFADYRLPTDT